MSHLSVPQLWRTRVVLLTLQVQENRKEDGRRKERNLLSSPFSFPSFPSSLPFSFLRSLERGVTEEQLERALGKYGTIVRVQGAESQKGNGIAYVSFVDPQSVKEILAERKTSAGSSSSWKGQAKVPEGGEWTKWSQPTAVEFQNAQRLKDKIAASSRAVLEIPPPPPAAPQPSVALAQALPPPPLLVELDPRQIFFIGSLLSSSEQTKELKLAFGDDLQLFPLFVADVIKAGKQWFPASLERCESFSEFDDHSVVFFTNQVSDSPRWKSFLKKADPRYRSPEKILTDHIKQTKSRRDYEQQLALSVAPPAAPSASSNPPSPARNVPAPVVSKRSSSNVVLERQPPRPATSTRPTVPITKEDLLQLYMKPILISATDLCLIASSVSMIDLDAKRDIEISEDGSYITIRFNSVERADRAYALLDGLQLDDGSKITLYRTRAFVKEVVVTRRLHLNTPLLVTPTALYNSISQFGLINSCQPGSSDDGTGGVVVQFRNPSSRQDLLDHLERGEKLLNRGRVYVWSVDTQEKLLELASQLRAIGRVDLSSRDFGKSFTSHNQKRYIRIGDLSTTLQIADTKFRADGTDFTIYLENLAEITATDYPHFDAPSTSLKDFYHLNVQRLPSQQLPAQSLVGSTNAVAGPSRTFEHPSIPIASTSSSSQQHHQLPQDPRRAAPSNIRRPPSPPPSQPSASTSSSTNVPTFQPAEERRAPSPVPTAKSIDASMSSRETARGRSPPRASASARPVEIEDAAMDDVEQPSAGPSVHGGVMLGPTGARVVPRGRRRSASPGYVAPARLLQPRPTPRKSRATDPVSFLQDLNPNVETRMSRETAAKMLQEDTELREWVWAEIVAAMEKLKLAEKEKEKEKEREDESRMDVDGGGEGSERVDAAV